MDEIITIINDASKRSKTPCYLKFCKKKKRGCCKTTKGKQQSLPILSSLHI